MQPVTRETCRQRIATGGRRDRKNVLTPDMLCDTLHVTGETESSFAGEHLFMDSLSGYDAYPSWRVK